MAASCSCPRCLILWLLAAGLWVTRARATSNIGRYSASMIGSSELLLVLAVVLVLFGGAKLPQLARSLGQAQKEFRRGVSEDSSDDSS